MGAVMSFNTIVEKVDYIEKNFELKPVLLNDDRLASMLIDMIMIRSLKESSTRKV